MSQAISDPAVLAAIAEMEEESLDIPLVITVADHIRSEKVLKGEQVTVTTENPAVIPLALASLQLGTELSEITKSTAEMRFDLEYFIDALKDTRISANTRLVVADALSHVPGFDDSLELAEYKDDSVFSNTYKHTATMAHGYLVQAMAQHQTERKAPDR